MVAGKEIRKPGHQLICLKNRLSSLNIAHQTRCRAQFEVLAHREPQMILELRPGNFLAVAGKFLVAGQRFKGQIYSMKLHLIRMLGTGMPNSETPSWGGQIGRLGTQLKNGTIPDKGTIKMNKTSFVYGVIVSNSVPGFRWFGGEYSRRLFGTTMKTAIIASLLVFALAAQGQTYYVNAAASGNGSGADWGNAYTDLPASLQRGATYYVAAGNYGSHFFNDAVSGTSLITIKKATVSDHGTTNGWLVAYANQAVFVAPLKFRTSYYIFNGQVRNESNWFAATNYGFSVVNATGDYSQSIKVGGLDANGAYDWGGAPGANYIQISYTAVIAQILPSSGAAVRSYQIDLESTTATTGFIASHCLVMNGNNHFFLRSSNGSRVEYCGATGALCDANNHGEIVNLYYNTPNAVVCYNIFKNNFSPGYGASGSNPFYAGTAVIALVTSTNCAIYGNLFWSNACTDAVLGWNGPNNSYLTYNTMFCNNTIVDGWGSQGVNLPQPTSGTQTGGNIAENNIWYNSPVSFASCTHDYNATSASSAISGESHSQAGLASSIFVNYAGGDFRLAVPTSPGLALPAPYNTDMKGNVRGSDGTWDRGAYEYGGVADTTPPVISNVGSSSVTSISAVIGWATDEAAASVVQYGPTTAYGSTATNTLFVTAHIITLSSLAPNTLYHYRVSSTDAAGNASTSGDFTFTTGIADTAPPTVTLTVPANGVTISNTVGLSATAVDNIGVAGVKFFVNGTQLVDVTSPPYSYNWDSSTVANGTYKLCAQARDAAGNVAWSGTNNVTVNNTLGALPNPVASWSFNEGTGSTAADSVSTNTLILQNGATWAAAGISGAALSLDGVTGYADAADSPRLDFNGSAMSVAAWVNLQNQGTWQQLVAKVSAVGTFTSPYYSWHLFAGSVSTNQWRPQFQLVNSSGTSVNVSSSTNVNYGEWVYVVGVYDGSMVWIYVNGSVQGSVAQSGNILAFNQPLYIGASGLPGEFTKGLIDEVRVYSVALSATQVQALYDSSLPPVPIGLHVVSF